MISKPDYSQCAEFYDAAENSGAEVRDYTNDFIEKILKKHKVKTVLDLSCGTGSQVFYLAQHGYEVVGADISLAMLKVAKSKARKNKMKIPLLKGDMSSLKVSQFDAVITIFNAIGHLSKSKFEKTLRNISKNLNAKGIYVFDIFNTNMNAKLEAALKVDAVTTVNFIKIRKIQECKINKKNGIMTVFEEEHRGINSKKPKIKKWKSTLQTYTQKWLSDILARNGFKIVSQFGPHGKKFSDKNSSSILIVAQRKNI